ncbi:MAG: glycoside hydrolase family 25 protein [Firmicutes bacterium]|nr:glycoside hydrolase family 25 protein [Bacillota bacterium]
MDNGIDFGNGKKKNNIFARIFTSKFFWLVLIFAAIIVAVMYYASMQIEKARSTYAGLPAEGGYAYSDLSYEYFYRDGYNFLAYEDDEYYTRRGIDVSEFQGGIDWKLVAECGVQFVMVRLGYTGNNTGIMNLDAYFETNVKGAREAGLDVGVYYFSQARSVEEAIAEAQFVCKNIRNKKINMPVAFDMEPLTGTESDRIHGLTMREITEISDAFCDIVEKHGYEAMIYGNPTWIYKRLNLGLLTGRNLWLAHYTDFSDFPYRYSFWQYTDRGTIDGIEGAVDLDIQFIKKD